MSAVCLVPVVCPLTRSCQKLLWKLELPMMLFCVCTPYRDEELQQQCQAYDMCFDLLQSVCVRHLPSGITALQKVRGSHLHLHWHAQQLVSRHGPAFIGAGG